VRDNSRDERRASAFQTDACMHGPDMKGKGVGFISAYGRYQRETGGNSFARRVARLSSISFCR